METNELKYLIPYFSQYKAVFGNMHSVVVYCVTGIVYVSYD